MIARNILLNFLWLSITLSVNTMTQTKLIKEEFSEQLITICKNNGPECTVENLRRFFENTDHFRALYSIIPLAWATYHGREDICVFLFDVLEDAISYRRSEESRKIKYPFADVEDEGEDEQDGDFSDFSMLKYHELDFVLSLARKFQNVRHSLTKMIELLSEITTHSKEKQTAKNKEVPDICFLLKNWLKEEICLSKALRFAVIEGHADLVEELLKMGVPVNQVFEEFSFDEALQVLLKKVSGREALHIFKQMGVVTKPCPMPWDFKDYSNVKHTNPQSDYDQELLRFPSSYPLPDAMTKELIDLSRSGNDNALPRIQELLTNGASLEVRDEHGLTALQWSLIRGHEKYSKFFWHRSLDQQSLLGDLYETVTDWLYRTYRDLHERTCSSIDDLITRCISRSASRPPECYVSQPSAPFLQEKKHLRTWIVTFFVPILSCIDREKTYTHTLSCAIERGNAVLVQKLLELGIFRDVTLRRIYKDALTVVVNNDRAPILKLLVQALGGKIYYENERDHSSYLETALRRKQWNCVHVFLEAGCELPPKLFKVCDDDYNRMFIIQFFLRASIARYAPHKTIFQKAHKQLFGILTALQERVALYSIDAILEHNPEQRKLLIDMFLYAFTCPQTSREALFGKQCTDTEKQNRLYHLMKAVFNSVKDHPSILSYLFDRAKTEMFKSDSDIEHFLLTGTLFDEPTCHKILQEELNKKYNETIGIL